MKHIVIALGLLASTPALAETLVVTADGQTYTVPPVYDAQARIADGGTIRAEDHRVRLSGIDEPELGSPAPTAGGPGDGASSARSGRDAPEKVRAGLP
ncbi:MAG: hypothetical protein JOY64_10505 [Alphaproteobacteria bacterium]|nr:hypothetical protein [Alphaproteobacteria bacterium]MBV8408050.1 hypothetical protein [Alphaproteobacteria bacterium]